MVKTNASQRRPMLLIDVIGASLVGAGLFGCGYVTFGRGETTAGEIRELSQVVNTVGRDLTTLQAARDRQRAVLAEAQKELSAGRQLPTSISIEEYFQMLSGLADDHQLRIVRQNPLNSRQYPGLLEQRFAYELTGSLPDLATFFKAVEEAEFWADIAYLRIESAAGSEPAVTEDRRAVLTLSLFSALRAEPPAATPSNG